MLKAKGELTYTLIRSEPHTLSADGYRRRFGTLTAAFRLAGYNSPRIRMAQRRKTLETLRKELMDRLVNMFPGEVSILSSGKRSSSNNRKISSASWRSVFCFRTRFVRISAASPIHSSNCNSDSSRSNQRACPLASIPKRTAAPWAPRSR